MTISIIVVLATLVFLGFGRLKLMANKAASVNNIRNLSTATLVSAGDNNGRFLGIHSSFNTPYRFNRNFRHVAKPAGKLAGGQVITGCGEGAGR